MRHFTLMILFALLVAAVFALVGREGESGRLRYGLKIFAEFVGVGFAHVVRHHSGEAVVRKLQQYQAKADEQWGFDFDMWDRLADPQASLPGVVA